jgi:hypothetical protein
MRKPRSGGAFVVLATPRIRGDEFPRQRPLATGDGKPSPLLSPLRSWPVGVSHDRTRGKYVVRWTADGRRRTKRFDAETDADQFFSALESSSAGRPLALPRMDPSLGTSRGDGIYRYETNDGPRWRFVFIQSDGSRSSRGDGSFELGGRQHAAGEQRAISSSRLRLASAGTSCRRRNRTRSSHPRVAAAASRSSCRRRRNGRRWSASAPRPAPHIRGR